MLRGVIIAGIITFLVMPFVIVVFEIAALVHSFRKKTATIFERLIDILTVLFTGTGVYLVLNWSGVSNVDWQVRLISMHHTFLATDHQLSVYCLIILGTIFTLITIVVPIRKMTPQWRVCTLSGLYLFVLLGNIIITQISPAPFFRTANHAASSGMLNNWWLWLFMLAVALQLLAIRTTVYVVRTPWENKHIGAKENSKCLPIFALLVLPGLIAIVVTILLPFGQSPFAFFRAFTETAEWTFSTKAILR